MTSNANVNIDSNGDALAEDLMPGMNAIAEFWGMPERQAYHMASKGTLPGVFRMGRKWFGSKSAAREYVKSRASGGRV